MPTRRHRARRPRSSYRHGYSDSLCACRETERSVPDTLLQRRTAVPFPIAVPFPGPRRPRRGGLLCASVPCKRGGRRRLVSHRSIGALRAAALLVVRQSSRGADATASGCVKQPRWTGVPADRPALHPLRRVHLGAGATSLARRGKRASAAAAQLAIDAGPGTCARSAHSETATDCAERHVRT